jgi:putative serine protease PepD
MTETQHDPNAAQAPAQPQWIAPQPYGESGHGTVQAREGEYAWQGSGQPQQPSAQPSAWGGGGPYAAGPYGTGDQATQTIDPAAPGGPGGAFGGGQGPGGLPGADHAQPRRRSPMKFGLGVVSAFIIAAAGVGGVTGAYFGSHNSTASPVVTSVTGASTSNTSTTIGKVANAVLPSVVQVNENTGSVTGVGSGMIISSDGKIVTNNHVIADYVAEGGQLTVTLYNGKTYDAKVIGYIAADDIAVIQAQGASGLTPVTFADSSKVQVGDETIAIGSPDQLQNTVTSGIVSALNRKVSITESTNNGGGFPGFGWRGLGSTTTVTYSAIQTDASINPGNSGGPLLDAAGQVVGMNSAIYSSSTGGSSDSGSVGLGFAIPSNTVTGDIQKIENGGGDATGATS